MPIGLGATLGIGGGRSATSSGAPGGGGGAPISNELSVSFDGSNDYLWVGSASELDLTGNFTLSLWVKADSWPSAGSWLLVKRDWAAPAHVNYQMVIYGQKVYVNTTSLAGAVISSSTLSTGTWYNIVATVNPGTECKLYINGSLETTASIVAVQKAATPLAIGAWTDNTSLYGPHDGLLDEVAIFDSLLSAPDVASIYNGGAGVTNLASLGPVGWWRMGDSNPASAGSSVPLVTNVASGGTNATQSKAASQPTLSADVP
jgi:hypothetical protein